MIKISEFKNKVKYLLIFTLVLSISFVVAGCSKLNKNEQTGIEIKELVNYYSTENMNNETASITSEYLYINTKDGEKRYKLLEEEFFVSIAPYVEQTHP